MLGLGVGEEKKPGLVVVENERVVEVGRKLEVGVKVMEMVGEVSAPVVEEN